MSTYDDSEDAFDVHEKVDMLLKKAFGVPTTKDDTFWFNETFGKSLTIFENNSINVYSVPDEPLWDDISMSDASLAQYDIKMTNSGNFGINNFDEIEEIYYDENSVKTYTNQGSKSPGAYLDSTKTVVLFVGLKLDIMKAPNDNAIAFIKYGSDSSQNSILSNSFQFNHNKLTGTILNGDGNPSGLTAFQPYYYTLQYSKSNTETFGFSTGNWFFDFKSGIITFSDEPTYTTSTGVSTPYTFSSDDEESLYFTFVKYVGPRGLDKLITVDDEFDSTADTSAYYENQIVVDSSNSEIYLLKDGSWNSIGGGGTTTSSGTSVAINNKGQTFHELLTGAPEAFTKNGLDNTLLTIDISWNFDDIIPTASENRFLNFPMPNYRERIIPYMSHIYFDISSTSDISVSYFDVSLDISFGHDYNTDDLSMSGSIPVDDERDISFVFGYKYLRLERYQDTSRNFTINVWGVNESSDITNVYNKLIYTDVSFIPDSEASFEGSDLSGISQTNREDVSGTIIASDNDHSGNDISFSIVNNDSTTSLYFDTGSGIATIMSQADNSAVWNYSPNDNFTGNDSFTIRTHIISSINNTRLDEENGYTGFYSDQVIKIFVDKEATFTHVSMIEVSGGLYTTKERLSIIDTDVSFTNRMTGTFGNGTITYDTTILETYGIDLSTAVATTDINSGDVIELSIYETTKAFMIRNTSWNSVDTTGWTIVAESGTFTSSQTDTQNLYTRTYNIGTHYIDTEAAFYIFQKADLNLSRFSLNSGETVKGNLLAVDLDGDVSFSINDSENGEVSVTNGTAEIYAQSDNSAIWHFTPATGFTGDASFNIKTEDPSGGISEFTINIFVDTETTFSHVSMIEVSGGLWNYDENYDTGDYTVDLKNLPDKILAPISTTTSITNRGTVWSSGSVKYTTNLADYGIDLSTAVATTDINTGSLTGDVGANIELTIYETTKAFVVIKSHWTNEVDLTGWTYVATDQFILTGGSDDSLYTRTYNIGTHYIDVNSAMYIFQKADLNLSRFSLNSGETVKGNLLAVDQDGDVSFSINGYESGWALLEYDNSAQIYAQSDNSAIWHFTPATGFTGDASFNITTTDSSNNISEFTINIYVDNEADFNPSPYNSDTSGISQTNGEDVSGIVYAVDADGDISFSIGGYEYGWVQTEQDNSAQIVSQTGVSAEWLYRPDTDFSGTDTFTIRTTDTSGNTTDQIIKIFVDNEATFSHVSMIEVSGGSYASKKRLSIIDTDAGLTKGGGSNLHAGDTSYNSTLLQNYGIDLSTAVATIDVNSGDVIELTIYETTKAFMIDAFNFNDVSNVDVTGWTLLASNIGLTVGSMYENDTQDLYTRTYNIGTHYIDTTSAFYIFQKADLNMSRFSLNSGETVKGNLLAVDQDGDVSFSINGYESGWALLEYDNSAQIYAQSDNSAIWHFTPATGFTGDASFNIKTEDPSGGISEFTINIFVDTEATFNTASDLSGSTNANVDVSGTITLATESDGTGDVSFTIIYDASYGTATINSQADNSAVWLYSPDTDFSGTDTFTIRTTDTSGGTTDQIIKIFVDEEAIFNPTPYNSDTSGISQTNGEDVSGIVYATDADGDISFSIVGGGDSDISWALDTGYGTATIHSYSDNSAVWLYSPNTDFSGTDTFTIRTTDASGGTTDISINIFVDTEANFTPTDTFNNVYYSDTSGISQQGEIVSGTVYATDDDGDPVFTLVSSSDDTSTSTTITTNKSNAATITQTNLNVAVWTFTPSSGFTGTDTFFVRTTDPSGGITDISINIFVDEEADFNPDILGTNYKSDTSGISQEQEDVSGIVYASDVDGDISFSIVGGGEYGWVQTEQDNSAQIVSQTGVSAEWLYRPETDFSGTDTFTIRTTDTSGGTTDQTIIIFVDTESVFTGDLSMVTNVGEDTSGVVYISDADGLITCEISNNITNGTLSYTISPTSAETQFTSDISISWEYTADAEFTGEESFIITTTDASGGISTQEIIIKIPYIYEIDDHSELASDMLSVHNNLIPVGVEVTVDTTETRYNLSGTKESTGYQFDIYKVDETAISKEYLSSNMTSYGLGGINLSYIMKKVFANYSIYGGTDLSYVESKFYNSLLNSSETGYIDSSDINVYIAATNKSSGEVFMARINKDLPGFDEMNPWYLTNKVNSSSSLDELSSGLGSGALPSSELQTNILNNSLNSNFDTSQIDGRDPIIIHINSNAFENHYLYFATKL